MAVRRARNKASGRRPKIQGKYPARYSHDFPIHGGHDYVLNSVPLDIWKRAKARAHSEQRAVRHVLITALDLYGRRLLNL